ncbi:hypothetical protein [Sorangium sp. So ce1335]|uniref:hypothetical protein n=1 Tax=Sorangium sp. So ce1335 TaxID=3133335 RepID=UPI003F5FF533
MTSGERLRSLRFIERGGVPSGLACPDIVCPVGPSPSASGGDRFASSEGARMAESHTSDDVEKSGQASSDRLWVLVNANPPESTRGRVSGRRPRETVVVRDGDNLLVSVDVGRSSALSVPFKMVEPGCSEATLIVRLAAASAPCAGCVDESLARAARELGGLDAESVFRAVRAAIAGCAARAHGERPCGAADAGGPLEGAGPPSSGAFRLAPANAPHVPAGSALPADTDIDVILIL